MIAFSLVASSFMNVAFLFSFPPCLHACSSCGVKVIIDQGATSLSPASTVLIDIIDLLTPRRALLNDSCDRLEKNRRGPFQRTKYCLSASSTHELARNLNLSALIYIASPLLPHRTHYSTTKPRRRCKTITLFLPLPQPSLSCDPNSASTLNVAIVREVVIVD